MFKKIALGLVVFIVLYAALVVGMALRTRGQQDVHLTELKRLGALGDAVKLEEKEATLVEACAKLPRVDAKEMLAYFPKTDDGLLPDDDAKKRYGTRTLLGVDSGSHSSAFADVQLPTEGWDVGRWIFEFSSDFPMYWDLYISWAYRPFGRDITNVKYLVVHQLASLDLPSVTGETYIPGHMTFRSAVLDAKSGKVLCEGNASIDQKGTVNVAGSGRTQADAKRDLEANKEGDVRLMFFGELTHFALRDVCSLGGEWLCKETFGTYAPP